MQGKRKKIDVNTLKRTNWIKLIKLLKATIRMNFFAVNMAEVFVFVLLAVVLAFA